MIIYVCISVHMQSNHGFLVGPYVQSATQMVMHSPYTTFKEAAGKEEKNQIRNSLNSLSRANILEVTHSLSCHKTEVTWQDITTTYSNHHASWYSISITKWGGGRVRGKDDQIYFNIILCGLHSTSAHAFWLGNCVITEAFLYLGDFSHHITGIDGPYLQHPLCSCTLHPLGASQVY